MNTQQRNLVVAGNSPNLLAAMEDLRRCMALGVEMSSPQQLAFRAANAAGIFLEVSTVDLEELALIRACRQSTDAPIIVILGYGTPADVSRIIRAGAFDCLDRTATKDQITQSFSSASTEFLSEESDEKLWRGHLIGESQPMRRIAEIIELVACRRCTVLITGETGTGKEMTAKAIHLASGRAKKPMVSVNCAAIPETLMETELFGHVRGAFTGASANRIGRFEQAHGGTLFLDEVGDLPLDLQAKLLRVLQEREIQKIGSGETVKIDVRVIAATNADLSARVNQGKFREDLFYRLNVVPIHMPALRYRDSDIPVLIEHFIQKICAAERIPRKRLSEAASEVLSSHTWPGNVRELENAVEHALVMSGARETLLPSDFSLRPVPQERSISTRRMPPASVPEGGMSYSETLQQFEREILKEAMAKARGNKSLAADLLQLPRTTLIHKLRALDQSAA